jgi:coenzyme F420-reducing hydrogenase alpha subunit
MAGGIFMSERREIRITVPALTRVEGEGALDLAISDGRITDLRLAIYEPPRYFEKFLEGREPAEVPDIVARICGICPVAYQMSAVQALEQIAGFTPPAPLLRLRRIMYCGEWIQSHALHIHMLAAPDFLGCSNITELARTHEAEVRRGLMLQSLGNELIALFGGRSVHPVGVKIGGFHRIPSQDERTALQTKIEAALPEAADLVRWCASLPVPDDAQAFVSVSLRHPTDYPIGEGRLVSDAGLDIDIGQFEQRFAEHQEPHSTALHALLDGQPYLVGPLARLNLNLDRLPESTRVLLGETSVRFPSRNMFHSMLARALEIHLALSEAARLLAMPAEETEATAPLHIPVGTGYGCTEAPRGILWHRYDTDPNGLLRQARIVPPTSQNQARIEQDLHQSLQRFGLERDSDSLRLHAEQVIRNYDPCISCATHFLDLRLVRNHTGDASIICRGPLIVIGAGSAHGADRLGPHLIEQLAQEPLLAQPLASGRLQLLPSLQPLRDGLMQKAGDARLVVIDLLAAPPGTPTHLRHIRLDGEAQALAWNSHSLSLPHLAEWRNIQQDGDNGLEVLAVSLANGQTEEAGQLLPKLRDWLLRALAGQA